MRSRCAALGFSGLLLKTPAKYTALYSATLTTPAYIIHKSAKCLKPQQNTGEPLRGRVPKALRGDLTSTARTHARHETKRFPDWGTFRPHPPNLRYCA